MSETSRCFIAFDLPSNVRTSLKEIQSYLYQLNCSIRWVRPPNAHLTLQFLDEINIDQINNIKTSLKSLAMNHAIINTSLTHLGSFPIDKPNVLWVGVDDKSKLIKKLALEISDVCKDCGVLVEKQDFKAHITLGRVRSPKNVKNLKRELITYNVPAVQFQLPALKLFKSTLTPDGPIYKTISSHKLQSIDAAT